MDIFVEQIVKKEATTKVKVQKALIVFGVAVVIVVSFFLLFYIGLFSVLLSVGGIYLGYYLISNLDVEYEYIVTNGEVDIDKIIAKRKRKRLITFRIETFDRFGKYEDAPLIENGTTQVRADGISANTTEKYYADFTHSKFGLVRLIFSPEEKVIATMKPYFKRQLKMNFKD